MTVKQWRGKWVADFQTLNGKRVRRTSPVQTKRGAQEFEAELRCSLSASKSSSPPKASELRRATTLPDGFTEFANHFMTTYAVTNNEASTIREKLSTFRLHLVPFFENRRLSEIRAYDIEAYKAAKVVAGYKVKTINNHLAVLGKMLSIAVEWEVIASHPKLRKFKLPDQDFDWYRRHESTAYLSAMDERYPQWRAWFWIALRTGMRRGEIFALRWRDIDLDAQKIAVHHSVDRGKLVSTKGKRRRGLPMTDRLVQAVVDHRSHCGTDQQAFLFGHGTQVPRHLDHCWRPHLGVIEATGLRRIRVHDLRHTFASQLVSAGRSIVEVQQLLGHADLQMTLRYAHLAPERMRDAVDVLEGPEEPVRHLSLIA